MASVPPHVGLTAAWPLVQGGRGVSSREVSGGAWWVRGPGCRMEWALSGLPGPPPGPVSSVPREHREALWLPWVSCHPGLCRVDLPEPGEPAWPLAHTCIEQAPTTRVCRQSHPHWSLMSGTQAAFCKEAGRLGLAPAQLPQSFSPLSLAQEAAPVTSLWGQTDLLQGPSLASQCILSL